MNQQFPIRIERTSYDKRDCRIGIVHLGYGAFHRAHQAVYIDDYMHQSGDLRWGIAAVNLRQEQSADFSRLASQEDGYLLKTTTSEGVGTLREIRSHVRFEDWSQDRNAAENLLCLASVKAVSITVTESGYYMNDDWTLDPDHEVIAAEINGQNATSVYAYLASALNRRMNSIDQPISILCCDNIRSNGTKLSENFQAYLKLTGETRLLEWLHENCTFPNSMVDRITPRATEALREEIALLSPPHAATAIHSEDYIEWVLEDRFADEFPGLEDAGVKLVEDVDPYEEAKIRILNGGHTALCYLGALAGHDTFDQVMTDPRLRAHFDGFEKENVLPGLTLNLPFDKDAYCRLIVERFSNAAISDALGRICMDGWSKFPIFVRPTLKSCLKQGISPHRSYLSIASWYVYARRFLNGQTHIEYVEPYWQQFVPLLQQGNEVDFAGLEALWSDLPRQYDEFIPAICAAIKQVDEQWPV